MQRCKVVALVQYVPISLCEVGAQAFNGASIDLLAAGVMHHDLGQSRLDVLLHVNGQ